MTNIFHHIGDWFEYNADLFWWGVAISIGFFGVYMSLTFPVGSWQRLVLSLGGIMPATFAIAMFGNHLIDLWYFNWLHKQRQREEE